MAGTRFYKAEAADSRFVDTNELAEELEPYARKTDIPEPQDMSGYARKEDIPGAPDLSSYALKSEIPKQQDLSGYETASHAEATYQPRGDYATTEALTSGLAKKADTSAIPDVSGFAEKSALSAYALASAIPDVSGYETAAHAAATYQPKGDYALKSDIPAGTSAPLLVLDAAAEVPAGTQADTLIVRRS